MNNLLAPMHMMNQYSSFAMKTQPLRVTLREATAKAILEAAEHVAARDGLTGANLQAIAEKAGVAVGTIYNYFEDKPRLFDELFTLRREELFVAIDAATKEHRLEPFAEQLRAFVRAVFVHFDVRRDFLRMALEAERLHVVKGKDPKKGPAMQQLHEQAERIMRIGIREKAIRDEGADLLGTVLVAIVRGLLLARAQGDAPFAHETDRVVSLFLRGAGR
jgi:AcrR family transcriptional regulator